MNKTAIMAHINKMYFDGWCANCKHDMLDCTRSEDPPCLHISHNKKEDDKDGNEKKSV